jgi:hypothetical protein
MERSNIGRHHDCLPDRRFRLDMPLRPAKQMAEMGEHVRAIRRQVCRAPCSRHCRLELPLAGQYMAQLELQSGVFRRQLTRTAHRGLGLYMPIRRSKQLAESNHQIKAFLVRFDCTLRSIYGSIEPTLALHLKA